MIKGFYILSLISLCFFSGYGAIAGSSVESYVMCKDTIKEDPRFPAKEYFLKTGKSFTILQSYESDYLVNAYVFGKGFPDSGDTILFDEIELIDTVMIADLNNDNYEEIYIFTRGFFPGAYDHVFGVASDEDRGYSLINFYDLKPADLTVGGLFEGYQGQDVYAMENNLLKRVFPVYSAGDFYDHPSRGFRTLYYTIEKTEMGFYYTVVR